MALNAERKSLILFLIIWVCLKKEFWLMFVELLTTYDVDD